MAGKSNAYHKSVAAFADGGEQAGFRRPEYHNNPAVLVALFLAGCGPVRHGVFQTACGGPNVCLSK